MKLGNRIKLLVVVYLGLIGLSILINYWQPTPDWFATYPYATCISVSNKSQIILVSDNASPGTTILIRPGFYHFDDFYSDREKFFPAIFWGAAHRELNYYLAYDTVLIFGDTNSYRSQWDTNFYAGCIFVYGGGWIPDDYYQMITR